MHNQTAEPSAPPDTMLLSPDASPDPKLDDDAMSDTAEDEMPLVELLLQASETIRAERARADAAEEECAVMRAQLDGVCAAYHRSAAQYLSLGHTATDELFTYVGQHVVRGSRAASARATSKASSGGDPTSHHRSGSRATTTTTSAAAATSSSSAARAPSRGSVTVATQSYRRGWEAAAAASPPGTPAADSADDESPPVSHRHRDPTAKGTASPPAPTQPARAVDDESTPHDRRQKAATSGTVEAMACRLRRALAPRPAEAVMGDIIHTMVHGLQRDVQAALAAHDATAPATRLRGFAMVRVRPCVYQLLTGPPANVTAMARGPGAGGAASLRRSASPPTATPYRSHYLLYRTAPQSPKAAQARVHTAVVHLTIDSGALRVVRGGGHVDFVEYLERLLRIKL